MARVCEVIGTRPMAGHNVSHAHNKTKRQFNPNLQSKRVWVPSRKCYLRLTLSTKAIRLIDKYGIEKVLDDLNGKSKR